MKLKSKFLIYSIFLIIIWIVFFNISFSIEKNAISEMVLNHLKSVASIQHSRIEDIYAKNCERFSLVASRTQLRLSLQQYNDDKDKKHLIKINKILIDALSSIKSFRCITIYDTDANWIASTSEEKDPISFLPELKNATNFINTDFKSNGENGPLLILTGPLLLNDKIIGIMEIKTDISSIKNAVQDYSGLGESGETIIAQKQNDSSIIFLMPTRFDKSAALSRKINPYKRTSSINFAFNNKPNTLINISDYRGIEVWAVTKYIEEANWGIVVKIDQKEATKHLNDHSKLNILTLLILILLLTFFFIITFKTIIIPIQELTSIATLISNGDTTNIKANISSNDEIGMLAKTFNEMIHKLTESNNSLILKNSELNAQIKKIKEIEAALESSEFKFKELFEQSPIGLALCEMNGDLISVNPTYAKIIGYSIEETLTLSYWDITPKKYEKDEQEQLRSLRETKKYGPYEKEYIHKNGHLVPVRLNGMIVNYGDKDFIWSSVEDITDFKKSEQARDELNEQLKQSHKMEALGTLAGGIAHDFNNILSAILGFSDLALEDMLPNDSAKKHIEKAIKASLRAKELVSQILMFSRKEFTKMSSINISKTIIEVLKLLRASTPSNIKIETSISENCSNILGNETQLHQIVLNVATNAIQSITKDEGIIKISLSEVNLSEEDLIGESNITPGKFVCFSIKDNGIGIKPEIVEKIFDPYFTTKEVGKGSGMGLAVVSGIVKNHNGFIKLKSEISKGTDFKIFLPITDVENSEKITIKNDLPRGNEHILIIDDEKDIIELQKELLQRNGYKVTAINSSLNAIELFKSNPTSFDLIISDYTMPQLTGDKLALNIFKIRKEIPVIICTGFNSDIDESKAKELGLASYLIKPVSKNVLLKTIREVLDKYN